jgi:RNA polymerase sigma-70 factor (ECF subfamily)
MKLDSDESIPTRASLLGRLKDWSDNDSWQDFFKTYWRLIYGVAIKQGLSDAEAQEVVQETMIAAAKELPQFKYDPAKCRFKTWLLHVTRNRVASQIKKRTGQVAHVQRRADGASTKTLIEQVPDPASLDLDACWEEEWKANLTTVALERLKRLVSPLHYRIFSLLLGEKKRAPEVAKLTGASVAQVYLVKHRVSLQFKKFVKALEAKPI